MFSDRDGQTELLSHVKLFFPFSLNDFAKLNISVLEENKKKDKTMLGSVLVGPFLQRPLEQPIVLQPT